MKGRFSDSFLGLFGSFLGEAWSLCHAPVCSLFINQMNLMDRGIKMAAEADEPLDQNFVRTAGRGVEYVLARGFVP